MSYSPPPPHQKWEMPEDPDLAAATKMLSAEEDDAEACLDEAGVSRNGDEFTNPFSAISHHMRSIFADSKASSSNTPEGHRSRCSERENHEILLSGMDDAMIAYADRMLGDDSVWCQLRAVRQAMAESL